MARNRLSAQVELLQENQGLGICGSGAIVIDELDRPIRVSPPKAFTPTLFWTSLWRVPFFHPSVCFRRKLFEEENLSYDPNAVLGLQDYLLWSQILHGHGGWNFVRPLICYRKHTGQATAAKNFDRRRMHVQICQAKVSQYLRLEISDTEAQVQWAFSLGHLDSRMGLIDLKRAVEFRETCVDILSRTSSHSESASVGFGVDLLTLTRGRLSAKFYSWLLSSGFRRKCMMKSLRVFPTFFWFKSMRNFWGSDLDIFRI